MYNFKDFEGEDKYERFKALQKKIHQDAINDYFKELHEEASKKGETGAIIPLSEGIILKDGTRLTKAEVMEYAKKDGSSVYDAYETDTDRFLRQFLNEIFSN